MSSYLLIFTGGGQDGSSWGALLLPSSLEILGDVAKPVREMLFLISQNFFLGIFLTLFPPWFQMLNKALRRFVLIKDREKCFKNKIKEGNKEGEKLTHLDLLSSRKLNFWSEFGCMWWSHLVLQFSLLSQGFPRNSVAALPCLEFHFFSPKWIFFEEKSYKSITRAVINEDFTEEVKSYNRWSSQRSHGEGLVSVYEVFGKEHLIFHKRTLNVPQSRLCAFKKWGFPDL